MVSGILKSGAHLLLHHQVVNTVIQIELILVNQVELTIARVRNGLAFEKIYMICFNLTLSDFSSSFSHSLPYHTHVTLSLSVTKHIYFGSF